MHKENSQYLYGIYSMVSNFLIMFYVFFFQNALDIDGNHRELLEYKGKVAIVVSVASYGGYSDVNYKGSIK